MKKYQPSNGTETMIFQSGWCDRCWKDRHAEDDPTKGCHIFLRAINGKIDDPEYPKEWHYNDQTNQPECTAFLSYEDHAKQLQSRHHLTRYERREKQGQQRLL